MVKIFDKCLTWCYSLLLALAASFTQNFDAVGFALLLAGGLVVADYMTGIVASLYEGKGIESHRLRWSFAKLMVYAVSLVATLATGVLLHLIEQVISPDVHRTNILLFTLACVKYEAYIIAWIETVSNIENARRIFSNNIFLKYIHWILSVEIVKKIPRFAEFLKEKREGK
ncbi:phage holin family protein [Dysgonomonas sp. ZJ279]|uniref:phage holin family protein n=1 Tax=Dysgonomonas sp. ZJ279 TaxID=2709796 RepID=UPI0013EBAE8C|nr:phage holin family protein [Dysgonomonas sp. ZJ279]